ncbi:DUF429 domain-containing protein [Ornithinimicrobium pekingense]|uniref:GTP pyrophosphokinase n=1 Tax=Ornithinimicrobium pekingense TaxID=384677 RepID=A0ABQ2F3L7_9MICO|nr:DUF429 domain-containing protein [Ornithinimicrobium pekingense]GGK56049.1 GTP pyrophosphokinase [Ornithinimicrobium pekingense]
MHYVGVDLAWGEKKPTGVAVVDPDGRLVHVSTQRTDEDIVAAVRPWTGESCLVAIDAPLVVTNATGNRPAEAALNRDFARFDAGAHPSNTGKPELSGTPRGARLARLLGLDMNPSSGRARRAIEVYPHPATVVLFRLGRTLKYKHKPGRSLETLRAALLTLVEHLERLAEADPPMLLTGSRQWRDLVESIRAATRKSELRVAEDQVDAVLCAYVARYAVAHPGRTTTYGDLATGYIVTPALPADLSPTPRGKTEDAATLAGAPHTSSGGEPSEGGNDRVRAAVRAYETARPQVEEATRGYVQLVTDLLDEAGINYLAVTGRTKSVESFAGKAARRVDGELAFPDPLQQITDQIGVRVVTYVLADVTAVARLLGDQLRVLDDRDMGQETAQEGRWGYSSRHVLVELDDGRAAGPEWAALAGRTASVQVRTVLQHAWAEFEHDIRYKGTVPEEHASDLDRRFTLAAGLLELADREFLMIRDRLRESIVDQQPPEDADPRIEAKDLAAFLAGRFPDAGWSRTDHYSWVSALLLELGITSLGELGRVLQQVDPTAVNERMDYRYPPGAVRRLDDALLAAFGERYVTLHGNAHRVELLQARLGRLRAAGAEGSSGGTPVQEEPGA